MPFCNQAYSSYQLARRHVLNTHKLILEARKPKEKAKHGYVYNENTKEELTQHTLNNHIFNNETNAQPTNDSDSWIINNNDVLASFHQYKEKNSDPNKISTYTLETNFNEILSLSGVLVLQKRYNYRIHPDNLFPPEFLKSMRQDVMNKYYKSEPFDPQLFLQVKDILLRLQNDDTSEDTVRMELLRICCNNDDIYPDECNVIRSLVNLVPSLYDCTLKSLSESHFSASFVHPLMHGLFSSKNPTNIAHCSNLIMDEESSNKNRPDYKVDIYESYNYAYTTVIGEIKSSICSSSLLINDFYRIGIYCKEAIDKHNLDTVLGFQAAGPSITWFGMNMNHKNLYIFNEITSIKIPIKKSEIMMILGRLDDLKLLSRTHRTSCIPSLRNTLFYSCPTFPISDFDTPESSKINKKKLL
ncbi:unnamed protein product [Cunninghamella echinulata]